MMYRPVPRRSSSTSATSSTEMCLMPYSSAANCATSTATPAIHANTSAPQAAGNEPTMASKTK
jgi:hypothetical protein